MIRYSVEELRYYYNKYDNYDDDYVESVNFLEDTLSDIIDSQYINNEIYHIFPVLSGTIVASFIFGLFLCVC
jgi:hypothetical protein